MDSMVDLTNFPLPTLVRISGPVSGIAALSPGVDSVSWWGHTTLGSLVAIPPDVVDEMVSKTGIDVWNPLPNEVDPIVSVERVRGELNAAAERLRADES